MRSPFLIALSLGFNSGLYFGIVVATITAFLLDQNISLSVLGIISIRSLPYSLKPLWSPIIDSISPPFIKKFSKRKNWILFSSCFLFILTPLIGFLDFEQFGWLSVVVFGIFSFFAATHDIALNGYRIEFFDKLKKSTEGNSFTIMGFRVGLLCSASFALVLSTVMPWKSVFLILSLMTLPSILFIFTKNEKIEDSKGAKKSNIYQNFRDSYKSLFKIKNIWIVIIIISFYKLSDHYLDVMLLPFLLNSGFSKASIAYASKTLGFFATIIGTIVGTYIIKNTSTFKWLLISEILAALTNLLFLHLSYVPGNLIALGIITFLESFCSALSNISLMTFASSYCNKNFTATHYAILISFSGLARALISTTSGFVVTTFGWENFFVISCLFSIPSILFILILKTKMKL